MLHTKFQGHQSIGSGEDFLRFLGKLYLLERTEMN